MMQGGQRAAGGAGRWREGNEVRGDRERDLEREKFEWVDTGMRRVMREIY